MRGGGVKILLKLNGKLWEIVIYIYIYGNDKGDLHFLKFYLLKHSDNAEQCRNIAIYSKKKLSCVFSALKRLKYLMFLLITPP
jgi:hypothetical protein